LSRDVIAQNNSIGMGTVSKIIQQSRNKIVDVDIMREMALNMKKDQMDLNYFISSYRSKKSFKQIKFKWRKNWVFVRKNKYSLF